MQMLDASSIIYAWDNYPEPQFPPLWRWLGTQIRIKRLTISQCAFDEVKKKIPECASWLVLHNIEIYDINDQILQVALQIKTLIKVDAENYNPKGVGANDVLIIATARVLGASLLSNEGVQALVPTNLSRCKIPAVCAMPAVRVECMSFLDYIKRSKAVYER